MEFKYDKFEIKLNNMDVVTIVISLKDHMIPNGSNWILDDMKNISYVKNVEIVDDNLIIELGNKVITRLMIKKILELISPEYILRECIPDVIC